MLELDRSSRRKGMIPPGLRRVLIGGEEFVVGPTADLPKWIRREADREVADLRRQFGKRDPDGPEARRLYAAAFRRRAAQTRRRGLWRKSAFEEVVSAVKRGRVVVFAQRKAAPGGAPPSLHDLQAWHVASGRSSKYRAFTPPPPLWPDGVRRNPKTGEIVNVTRLSLEQKLYAAFEYAWPLIGDRLGDEAKLQLQAFFSPESIALMTAIFAAYIASFFFAGLGIILTIGLVGFMVATVGLEAFAFVERMRAFIELVRRARSEAELRDAGALLAAAIAVIGVAGFLIFLRRIGGVRRGRAPRLDRQKSIGQAERPKRQSQSGSASPEQGQDRGAARARQENDGKRHTADDSDKPRQTTSSKSKVDIHDGATPGRDTKGRTKQYEKSGGLDKANQDFDAEVDPNTIVDRGGGVRTGQTRDGRKINIRPKSSDGRPTVEIQDGKTREKFRYGE